MKRIERVQERLAELKMSEADFARAIDTDQQTVNNWTRRDIPMQRVFDVAAATGLTPAFIVKGDLPRIAVDDTQVLGVVEHKSTYDPSIPRRNVDPGDYVTIPRLAITGRMGSSNGAQWDYEPDQIEGNAYSRAFLESVGWSPETHFSMSVDGDSLIDIGIRPGWSIVACRTDTAPEEGELFVVNYFDNKPVIKFIQVLSNGGLLLISANEKNPIWKNPVSINPDDADRVRIVGRVVYVEGPIGRPAHKRR